MLSKNQILFTFIFSLFYINVKATDYYVATDGNDANNGLTSGSPKATLASVFSTYDLDAGDIIHVAAGTYSVTSQTTVGADDLTSTNSRRSKKRTKFLTKYLKL